jgi:hypothetical protein
MELSLDVAALYESVLTREDTWCSLIAKIFCELNLFVEILDLIGTACFWV